MALTAGQIRRPRSSTAASRGLNDAEQSSGVADLCRQLISVSPFLRDDDCEEVVTIAGNLKRRLAESSSTKDVFRRGGGLGGVLEAVKELCKLGVGENEPAALPSANAVASLLSLLSAAFRGHRGNERYFADRLNGWSVLQTNLLNLLERILEDSNDEHQVDRVVILLTAVLQLAFGETDGTQLASAAESQRSKPGVPPNSDEKEAKISVRGHEIVVQPQACALTVRILLRMLRIEAPEDDSTLLALAKSYFSHVHAVVGLCLRNRYALWETGITSQVLEVWLDHDTTEQCHDASERSSSLSKNSVSVNSTTRRSSSAAHANLKKQDLCCSVSCMHPRHQLLCSLIYRNPDTPQWSSKVCLDPSHLPRATL